MKNNMIFSLVSLFALASIAIASSGSFGEVSGSLVYNAFISSAQTRTWTLVNNYNFSLGFYITQPNMSNVSISTSVTNGIIKAGSYFPINVTVISHTTETRSGYITAYAVSNGMNSTDGGASIRLATLKLIEINGTNVSVIKQNPLQNVNTTSTIQGKEKTNKTQGQAIQGATSTIPNKQNQNSSIQGAGSPAVSSIAVLVPYLVVAVVLLLVVVGALVYKMTKKNQYGRSRKRKIKK
jgi:hypothetical protein